MHRHSREEQGCGIVAAVLGYESVLSKDADVGNREGGEP